MTALHSADPPDLRSSYCWQSSCCAPNQKLASKWRDIHVRYIDIMNEPLYLEIINLFLKRKTHSVFKEQSVLNNTELLFHTPELLLLSTRIASHAVSDSMFPRQPGII